MDNSNDTGRPPQITVLGGGPAGLAVGYYAKKQNFSFSIYEATNKVGGNCITLQHKDFSFDSGAHRFHNQDVEITNEIMNLLGKDLVKLSVPSQIYQNGKFIDFPLSPLNLLRNLGLHTSVKVGLELATTKMNSRNSNKSFKGFALRTYGKTIAKSFLLDYSEKLWGVDSDKLSPDIAGRRLKSLNLKAFLVEAILGQEAKVEHLDGSFYYPKTGIGMIPQKLEEFCGMENFLKNSKITKVFHNFKEIQALEVNGTKVVDVKEVISTLPMTVLVQIMEPKPVEAILLAAKSLRYRNLILVTLFLNKESVTKNASVYFPEPDFPFTRVHEPRNRSITMSPQGKTSLVTEIPCQSEDQFWRATDQELIQLVSSYFTRIGWIKKNEIIDASIIKLNRAYPILEVSYEEKVQKIATFLKSFINLRISGRNGRFMYTHIHDMMRFGKEVTEGYTFG